MRLLESGSGNVISGKQIFYMDFDQSSFEVLIAPGDNQVGFYREFYEGIAL